MKHLTETEKSKMRETIKQVDAIFTLEGFEKTEQNRKIDDAVLSGRVSRQQVDRWNAYLCKKA